MSNQNSILILGGGFAGLTLAYKLASKKLGRKITLVNKTSHFLFTPMLYEAATTEEEMVTMGQVKSSVVQDLPKLLNKVNVEFIQAQIGDINIENGFVQTGLKRLEYGTLIMALGAESEYFNIKGAKENSIPLKTLEDALRIRNSIEFAIQAAKNDIKKKMCRVVVAGGGYTGVEIAAELPGLIRRIAWKNQYPLDRIEVVVVEAMGSLIPGLDPKLSTDAAARLRDLGVRMLLQTTIKEVTQGFLEFTNGEKLSFDTLIWSVGVRGTKLSLVGAAQDPRGRIKVNEFLQLPEHNNVYIIGDTATIVDKSGRPAPPTAQNAIKQAEYLGDAIPLLLKNQKPRVYISEPHGYAVFLGGKWAILKLGHWYIKGLPAYFLKMAAHIRFFAKFLGWFGAVYYVCFEMNIFFRND